MTTPHLAVLKVPSRERLDRSPVGEYEDRLLRPLEEPLPQRLDPLQEHACEVHNGSVSPGRRRGGRAGKAAGGGRGAWGRRRALRLELDGEGVRGSGGAVPPEVVQVTKPLPVGELGSEGARGAAAVGAVVEPEGGWGWGKVG